MVAGLVSKAYLGAWNAPSVHFVRCSKSQQAHRACLSCHVHLTSSIGTDIEWGGGGEQVWPGGSTSGSPIAAHAAAWRPTARKDGDSTSGGGAAVLTPSVSSSRPERRMAACKRPASAVLRAGAGVLPSNDGDWQTLERPLKGSSNRKFTQAELRI